MPDKYRLLKEYDSPTGRIVKGSIMEVEELTRWFGLTSKDLDIKTDWFEKFEEDIPYTQEMVEYMIKKEKLYTEEDMRKAFERGMTYGMLLTQKMVDRNYKPFEELIKELQSKDR